ncbi:MAG: beta-lactamase family protein [Flavobacteriaceae bacterium]|nr:beta-lactamase family protein [Flavobacteriaceae bacterium]
MRTIFTISILFLGIYTSMAQQATTEIRQVFQQYSKQLGLDQAAVYLATSDETIWLGASKDSVYTKQAPEAIYLASISKMFTATAIGILKDQGKLDFSDPLSKHLPQAIWQDLLVYEGIDYSQSITIAQCLQHQTGLADYFTATPIDGAPNLLHQLLMKPTKVWTPKEVLAYYKNNIRPIGKPNAQFMYSDTGYLLLGLLVEAVSGQALEDFFGTQIFAPLQMQHSYMYQRSKAALAVKPMPIYVGAMPINGIPSLTADWGGGGIVSTPQDLVRFFRAYNQHHILQKETRDQMQQWTKESTHSTYGFGIRKMTLQIENQNLYMLGHTGTTASFLWYVPHLDSYIAGSFNQIEASKHSRALVQEIVDILQKHHP